MVPLCNPIAHCLACDAPKDALDLVLNLGKQPLANTLLAGRRDRYETYPLALYRCTECGHGQLSHTVSPDILYANYAYASGTSGTLGRYFDWFADEAAWWLSPGANVLEIACNDGSLLRRLKSRGLFVTGVDPAANLTKEASSQGVKVITASWPLSLKEKFDLIVAMNVVAHGPHPYEFLAGVRDAISPRGLAVVQVSQGRMLEQGSADTIYHEHHSFFTIGSMTRLASRVGLRVLSVKEVTVHGFSLVFVLDRPDSTPKEDLYLFLSEGEFAATYLELPHSLGSVEDYGLFAAKANITMNAVKHAVKNHRAQGHPIAFVGCAAKAVVFMHATDIRPDYVFDEAPLKVGKWLPGIDRKILPLSEIGTIEEPLFALIGAWNFKAEIADKTRGYREGKETTFLTYFPEIEEFT